MLWAPARGAMQANLAYLQQVCIQQVVQLVEQTPLLWLLSGSRPTLVLYAGWKVPVCAYSQSANQQETTALSAAHG